MNWHRVNAVYCGLMWFLAVVLALVILVHGVPESAPPAHHALSAPIR